MQFPMGQKKENRKLRFSKKRNNLRVLRDLNELGERRRIVDSQISQNLAIQVDAGLLQTADELGIGHAVDAGRRIDTGNPQGTEITLARLRPM